MSLSNKLAITDVDVKGKRVLIRVRMRPIMASTMQVPSEDRFAHIV